MNRFELGAAAYLGQAVLHHLRTVRVAVAGAGGLGSNCAMHLVRSGFARLVLVDHDVVEPSNLNRQWYFDRQIGAPKVEALAENLRAVNPDLELTLHHRRVDAGNAVRLLGGCDAVVEAFDDPTAKKALVEAVLPMGAFLVAASGIGGYGRADALRTRRIRDDFILVGDGATTCGADNPPLSPMVGAAAAMQADAVLAHFLKRFKEKDNA